MDAKYIVIQAYKALENLTGNKLPDYQKEAESFLSELDLLHQRIPQSKYKLDYYARCIILSYLSTLHEQLDYQVEQLRLRILDKGALLFGAYEWEKSIEKTAANIEQSTIDLARIDSFRQR